LLSPLRFSAAAHSHPTPNGPINATMDAINAIRGNSIIRTLEFVNQWRPSIALMVLYGYEAASFSVDDAIPLYIDDDAVHGHAVNGRASIDSEDEGLDQTISKLTQRRRGDKLDGPPSDPSGRCNVCHRSPNRCRVSLTSVKLQPKGLSTPRLELDFNPSQEIEIPVDRKPPQTVGSM
jgi:hypothetical protein